MRVHVHSVGARVHGQCKVGFVKTVFIKNLLLHIEFTHTCKHSLQEMKPVTEFTTKELKRKHTTNDKNNRNLATT